MKFHLKMAPFGLGWHKTAKILKNDKQKGKVAKNGKKPKGFEKKLKLDPKNCLI